MKKFSGKTVVITGAGSGIGRGLAKLLAGKGAALALVDLSEDNLKETVGMLSDKVLSVRCYPLDVSDKEAVYGLADKVYKDFGRVDVVINNAGVALSETVEDMSYEDFEWVMDINFWGVVYGTKAFLPYLKRSSEAYIVNISSIFGLISLPTQSAYNASKFGVTGFTQAAMLDLRAYGVKMTTIMPGSVATYFNNHVPTDEDYWKIQKEDLGQIVVQLISMHPRSLPSKIELRPTMPGGSSK